MAWDPITSPVDHAYIAGEKTPGLLEVKGLSSPRKWDERNGYGLTGATLVFTGNGLSEFSLEIRLHTVADWVAWYKFSPLLARTPAGKRPRAVSFVHPWATDLGITAIVVLDLKQPVQEETGAWMIEIAVKQFRKAKITLAKPDGAAAGPTDPWDIYIEKLSGQLEELAK